MAVVALAGAGLQDLGALAERLGVGQTIAPGVRLAPREEAAPETAAVAATAAASAPPVVNAPKALLAVTPTDAARRLFLAQEEPPPPGWTCAGPPLHGDTLAQDVGPQVDAAWRTRDPVQAAAAARALFDCRMRAENDAFSAEARTAGAELFPDLDSPANQLFRAQARQRCQSVSAWHQKQEDTLRQWAAEGGVLGATADLLMAQKLPPPSAWPPGTAERLGVDLQAGDDMTVRLLRVLARWRPDELAAVGLGPAAATAQDVGAWAAWRLAQAEDEARQAGRAFEHDDFQLIRALPTDPLETGLLMLKRVPLPELEGSTAPVDWRARHREIAAQARRDVPGWSPERRAAAEAQAARAEATDRASVRCQLRYIGTR